MLQIILKNYTKLKHVYSLQTPIESVFTNVYSFFFTTFFFLSIRLSGRIFNENAPITDFLDIQFNLNKYTDFLDIWLNLNENTITFSQEMAFKNVVCQTQPFCSIFNVLIEAIQMNMPLLRITMYGAYTLSQSPCTTLTTGH